jgi:hypothetical protein
MQPNYYKADKIGRKKKNLDGRFPNTTPYMCPHADDHHIGKVHRSLVLKSMPPTRNMTHITIAGFDQYNQILDFHLGGMHHPL